MIQRIQSVYLLIAAVLTGSLFFFPMAEMADMKDLYRLNWQGIFQVEADGSMQMMIPGWALTILTVLTTAVSLITIFLYKKRMIQIRLCAVNMGLQLGLSGMIYYLAQSGAKELGAAEVSFNWPLVMPLIAIVFTYLALRGIGKDEALVRSLNRIR
ncbi:DUF4293 domain-containing protein [Marinilabilia salmonicolor]|uniref:DUF4293 domain-containing protein n=1 Tax=Marinilabilia salmonicolor TaxID=989 RepID=UPI00029A19CD|nr:DUF4293 domain-containing protein [Marinilabilia salmonicolor]